MLLVVDDDAGMRGGVVRLLKSMGYRAEGLASGEEALAQVRECKPTLVILDYAMPGMNGLEVLSAMRSERSLRDIPVIMCSAAEGPIREAAMRAGANAYLPKRALDPATLDAEIRRLIDPD